MLGSTTSRPASPVSTASTPPETTGQPAPVTVPVPATPQPVAGSEQFAGLGPRGPLSRPMSAGGRPFAQLPLANTSTVPLSPRRRSATDSNVAQTPLEAVPPELPPQVRTIAAAVHRAVEAQNHAPSTSAVSTRNPIPSITLTSPTGTTSPWMANRPRVVNPSQAQIAAADAEITAALDSFHNICGFLSALAPTADDPVPGARSLSIRPESPEPSTSSSPGGIAGASAEIEAAMASLHRFLETLSELEQTSGAPAADSSTSAAAVSFNAPAWNRSPEEGGGSSRLSNVDAHRAAAAALNVNTGPGFKAERRPVTIRLDSLVARSDEPTFPALPRRQSIAGSPALTGESEPAIAPDIEPLPRRQSPQVPVRTSTDTLAAVPTDTPEPVSTHTVEPVSTDTIEPVSTHTPEPVSTDTVEPVSTDTPEPTSAAASPTGGAGNEVAATRVQRSVGEIWLGNTRKVISHEALAVGLSTGIREVVAYLVRTAQNNAHGSEKTQEALAGAIVALIGIGNLADMAARRARQTNTATADIGNLIQIAGLAAGTIGALRTGELKDLLPALSKTVVYAGLRDTMNTLKPYSDNPHAGNPLAAQGLNTPIYFTNQFGVDWLQSNVGLSGAGLADKLHNVSGNSTEASAERRKIVKDSVGPGFAYVGANLAGEVADKIVLSMLEEILGPHGAAGIAQLTINHEPLHLPSGAEWGDMLGKTDARMSLFASVYTNTAAIGSAVTPARFGEIGATAINNGAGAASVALFCLPFVATLARKARATAGGSNNV